ncbi:hypothetical protein M8J76_014688 [Diaphorina citri]|nr:hypothetical protein M8J76_014688 [Diaphorina citri]
MLVQFQNKFVGLLTFSIGVVVGWKLKELRIAFLKYKKERLKQKLVTVQKQIDASVSDILCTVRHRCVDKFGDARLSNNGGGLDGELVLGWGGGGGAAGLWRAAPPHPGHTGVTRRAIWRHSSGNREFGGG